MKRPFIVTLGFLCLLAASYAFTGKKDPEYKNLKILPKDITHEQMDSVMHHFTASLAVRCNFCHVRNETTREWDWASDSIKNKLVAREMMTMTNKLNNQYFPYGGKAENLSTALTVTCYTCHHGATEPATKAPRAERPAGPRPPQDSAKRAEGQATKSTQ